ncbi:major histocompatibility complex class I-related gene protein-like [Podarcis raffonei]|uniref:major histocompatibility complex class I-related gene protein-like n=1 Tax=Podarcis raffonei TaxID=65483 RepID=UPI0023298CED|nr:major histocompatibility complex class I-related gene protein-like [Podarcis raffonei]
MLKAEKDNAQYWEKITQEFLKLDMKFSQYLLDLQDQYNQSNGFHTLQLMYGCELSPDGRKEGYYRYGYDGRDFLIFEKETLTWTAADREAQVMKRKWDAELAKKQYRKAYLEEECIEWLQRYLDYGNETLLRTELPVGKVTRQALPDSQESLICQAYGFYPREIDTTWRMDGKVMEQATFRRDVAPNSNGTYHAWLSIDVDPQDRNRYYCHIEHVSLTQPLVLAWEEPAKGGYSFATPGNIVGGMVAAAVVAVVGVAAVIYWYFVRSK